MRYFYEIPHIDDCVAFYNKEGRPESVRVMAIHKNPSYCDVLTFRGENIELTLVSIVKVLHKRCLLSEYCQKK